MRNDTTPVSELKRRTAALQKLLVQQGLEGALVLQNTDLFYFAGTIQQGLLYIPAEGAPLYMVRKELGRARAESALEHIVPVRGFREAPARLAEYGLPVPRVLGMELDVVPVAVFRRIADLFPESEIRDVTPLIRRVRAVKSSYELEWMRAAAEMVTALCGKAGGFIREGRLEQEVAADLEHEVRMLGHQGLLRMRAFNCEIFMGQFMSGANAAIPAYLNAPLGGPGPNPCVGRGCGWKRIARNEPVLFDYTGAIGGYLSDMTRIFAIGSLEDDLRRGYDDMVEVQELMKTLVRPGTSWSAVYAACLDLVCRQGHAERFMGAPGAQVPFIGHGIGLEIDEYPFIAGGFNDFLFEENMTFAFEPKVVFPGRGAVGIENTFVVTAEGPQALTLAPEHLMVL